MQKYQDSVIAQVNGSLSALAGAMITVVNTSGGSSTIYSDNGITPITTTLLTDSNGLFTFYAADGLYTITIVGSGVTVTRTNVLFDDPASDPTHYAPLSEVSRAMNAEILLAPLASPTFTGTPVLPSGSTATTQSPGNNSTALATTAYVDTLTLTNATNATNLIGSGTVSATTTGGAALTPTNATNAANVTATIASAVTATTQTAGDNSTKVCTTAFFQANKSVLGTPVASTSGTSISFTGIPTWAKRVTITFKGVGTSGTSVKLFQIGSGSLLATGYLGLATNIQGAGNAVSANSTGFSLFSNIATDRTSGSIILTLENSSTNSWCAQGNFSNSAGTSAAYTVSGTNSLGGALDRVGITTVNGTDTFAAGEINVMWE